MSWIQALEQDSVNQTTTLKGGCVFNPKHEVQVTIPTEGYNRWMGNGEFIQVALPDVSAGDREFLMSGICSDCYDAFADEMEEE